MPSELDSGATIKDNLTIPRVKWWKNYLVTNGSSMNDNQRAQYMDRFMTTYEQKMLKLKRVVAKNKITSHEQAQEVMSGIQFHFKSSLEVHDSLKFTCKTNPQWIKQQHARLTKINHSVMQAVHGDGISASYSK